jgi:N utilization substance protein B
MLYQHDLTDATLEEMQAHFEGWRGASESEQAFARELVVGTLDHGDEIDQELERQTAHWRFDRLAAVDRNILRLALFELLYHQDTPAAVVIDEAIEVAKKFGAEESPRFVNGVLDGFIKRTQDEVGD